MIADHQFNRFSGSVDLLYRNAKMFQNRFNGCMLLVLGAGVVSLLDDIKHRHVDARCVCEPNANGVRYDSNTDQECRFTETVTIDSTEHELIGLKVTSDISICVLKPKVRIANDHSIDDQQKEIATLWIEYKLNKHQIEVNSRARQVPK